MAFNPEQERRKGQRGMLDMFGGSPLSRGGMLSAGGTFVPQLNPFQRPGGRPPGMTIGPSMPTVDYGSGPVTELPGNILGPGGTLDPDRFGEKVWLDPWSWHYKPVKNTEGGGWRNPVLKPTMPGWEEGTYYESGKPIQPQDVGVGQNWIQYNTTDPASPYYQPPGPDMNRGDFLPNNLSGGMLDPAYGPTELPGPLPGPVGALPAGPLPGLLGPVTS